MIQMRVNDEFVRRIDDWRRAQPDLPSRSEALRYLIEQGLGCGSGATFSREAEQASAAVISAVGPAVRGAKKQTHSQPLEQRHIGLTLDGLDRLLAASEFWPEPAEALEPLAPYPVWRRKTPPVLAWLQRLESAAQQQPAQAGKPGKAEPSR